MTKKTREMVEDAAGLVILAAVLFLVMSL